MKKFFLFVLLLCASQAFSQNFNFDLRSQIEFSDEIIAGVWGYEKDSREYALVAGAKNLHIVEVTNPDVPKKIVKLPMASDWGKEVRTFQHFAFVSAESGPGLVIYDLSKLPSTSLSDYPKKEISQVNGQNLRVHTLHIDVTAGTLYLNGTWQGTLIFNLLPNPFSPLYVGTYNKLGNIHDGYADNDALWGRLPLKGLVIDPKKAPVIRLERGYYDDFHFDLGWISEGDAIEGFWEKGQIKVRQFFSTPETDVLNDLGEECFTTGLTISVNGSWIDVNNGIVRLVSPPIILDRYQSPYLQFSYWQNSEDTLQGLSVFLENEHSRIQLWRTGQNKPSWTLSPKIVLPSGGFWQIVFEAKDTIIDWEWGWLDIGLDAVEIRDGQPAPLLPIETVQVEVFPNPFHDQLFVRYLLPQDDLPALWRLFDVAGRQVLSGLIDSEAAVLELNPVLESGVYFFHIQQDEGESKTIKVVKF